MKYQPKSRTLPKRTKTDSEITDDRMAVTRGKGKMGREGPIPGNKGKLDAGG